MESYENELYEKIAEVASFVCRNPLVFVSETDIHSLMMSALMEINCLKKLYKTNVTIGKNKKGQLSEKMYRTMLVHREYGHNTKRWGRSDIVIFDEKDVKFIDHPINLFATGKYLSPKYIFEFGTEKVTDYEAHLRNDFEKLSKSKDKGFLIHIHRNFVKVSDKHGRYLENRLKFKKFKNTTIRVWKNIENKEMLKVLIFFVEIGGQKRTLKSKVHMFNPYTMSWKGVNQRKNLKEIERKVMVLLKK